MPAMLAMSAASLAAWPSQLRPTRTLWSLVGWRYQYAALLIRPPATPSTVKPELLTLQNRLILRHVAQQTRKQVKWFP